MVVKTKPIMIHGVEQWVAVVLQNGRILHVVKRWSEQAAQAEAMRWATVNS